METYNGWTNYETWRVNLENYSDIDNDTVIDCYANNTIYDISEMIKSEMEEKVCCDNDLAEQYALAFLSDVNYYEIAAHIVNNAIEDLCYENDITYDTNKVTGYKTLSTIINNQLIKATFDDITIQDVLDFIEENN